jgi:hypothetical protein
MPEQPESAELDPDWVRIHIFLPVNDPRETAAAGRAVEVVRNRYLGSTHSIMRPHVFEGWWWDQGDASRPAAWFRDLICWLVVDIEPNMEDVPLPDALDLIRLRIAVEYQQVGCPQFEVWIIAHQIMKLK